MAVEEPVQRRKSMDTQFPLLNLPPELWSRICRLAVDEDTIVLDYRGPIRAMKASFKQPAITRVCKAIRAETLPTFNNPRSCIYRGSNAGCSITDCICIQERLEDFLLGVPAECEHLISDLVVESRGRDTASRYRPYLQRAGYVIEDGVEDSSEGVELCKVTKEIKVDK